MTNFSQIAQIITNLEHFEISCAELERSLTNIRSVCLHDIALHCLTCCGSSSQRGGTIRVKAASSFIATRAKAIARITEAMNSKLELFSLSEYDWTAPTRQDSPSLYLYNLVTWLTTVVDTLAVKDTYKEEAYRGAVTYIASCFMVCVFLLLPPPYADSTSSRFPGSPLPSPCQPFGN